MPDEPAKLDETLDAQPYEPPRPRKLGRWALLSVLTLALAGCIAAPFVTAAIRRANEQQAVGALRNYAEAQIEFFRQHKSGGTGGFARDLSQLRGLLPPEMIAARGAGGRPYRGYLFQEGRTIAGKPADWSQDYFICATPAKYGLLHRRTFIIDTNGCVYGWDFGESGFVDDYLVEKGQWVAGGDEEEPRFMPDAPKYTPLKRP
jgi:type II secretory pathway pseudopilin PulG